MHIPLLVKDGGWSICNDNVVLEAFAPDTLIFAVRHRKGVSHLIDDLKDAALHMDIDSESPFGDAIPIPSDLDAVIDILKGVQIRDLRLFRSRRLAAFKDIKRIAIADTLFS